MNNYIYLHKQSIDEFLNYHKKNNIKIQNLEEKILKKLLNSKNKYFDNEYKLIEKYSNQKYGEKLPYQAILDIFQKNSLFLKVLKKIKSKNIIIYQELRFDNEMIDYLIETNKLLLVIKFKYVSSVKLKLDIKEENLSLKYKNLLKKGTDKEIKALQIDFKNEYYKHINIKNKISNMIAMNKYSKIINQEITE